jgi:hypothetical protein
MERRRHERCTLLAGVAGEVAGATRLRQARPSSACTFSCIGTDHYDVQTSKLVHMPVYDVYFVCTFAHDGMLL